MQVRDMKDLKIFHYMMAPNFGTILKKLLKKCELYLDINDKLPKLPNFSRYPVQC